MQRDSRIQVESLYDSSVCIAQAYWNEIVYRAGFEKRNRDWQLRSLFMSIDTSSKRSSCSCTAQQ